VRIVGVLVLASVLCATAPAETIRSLPNRSIGMYDVGPVWSPDGTQLLFSRIWSAPKAGEAYWLGTARNDGSGFRIFPRPRAEQWDLGASYSPDGTRLLMTRSEDYEVGSAVYVKDLASGAEQRLTPADATEFGAGWSPDGSRVLVLRDRDDDRVAYIERPDGTDVRELPIPHGRIFVRYLTDGALLVSRYGRDTTTFERLEPSGTLRPLPIPAARWSLSSIARAAKVMALVRDAGYEQPTLWIAHVDGGIAQGRERRRRRALAGRDTCRHRLVAVGTERDPDRRRRDGRGAHARRARLLAVVVTRRADDCLRGRGPVPQPRRLRRRGGRRQPAADHERLPDRRNAEERRVARDE
jgi:dipeptidyl aminopeptidase/acylaminoacyl peptidase